MQNSSSVRQFHHFQSKIHTFLPTSRTTQELILPGTQIISFQEKNLFIFQWRIVQFETEMRLRNETLRNESEMRLTSQMVIVEHELLEARHVPNLRRDCALQFIIFNTRYIILQYKIHPFLY